MLPDAAVIITFSLLSLAIVAAWRRSAFALGALRIPVWCVPFAAAAGCALLQGYLHATGLLMLLLLGWAAHRISSAARGAAVDMFAGVLLLCLCAALFTHQAPGFSNPRVLDAHRFSPDAAPYSQYANFDKGAAGLLLLVFCCAPVMDTRGWRDMLAKTLPTLLLTGFTVIAGALLLNYARFDPKLPAYAPVFLWLNLFFTCVAEEALFRGLVQRRLTQWLTVRGLRRAQGIALAVTAILFGIAHTGGGWGYVLLATLAGLGYGHALQRTGRIEAAILVHFSVNALHFLGFTYPRLA